MKDEWDEFPTASLADARTAFRGGGGGSAGRKLSAQEQKFLNDTRAESQSGSNSLSQYRKAAASIGRSNINPYRAKQIESTIPGEDSGGMSIGNRWNRFIYGVDDQEVTDFQYLQGLQSAQVLDRQVEQKGPQTESDARRLKLTEISPFNTPATNAKVIGDGVLRSRLLSGKAPFYVEWANKYGLNGLDDQGRTADAVWANVLEEGQQNLATQRGLRGGGQQGLSAADLRQYRALAERGASAEQLRAFVAELGGELVNADEITAARDRGGAVRTDVQYQGFKVKKVR